MQHGWYARWGAGHLNPKAYYYFIWHILEDYEGWCYVPEAMECFYDIVRDAEEAGVPLVVFFTPMSVDRHAMIYLLGYRPEYQRIKREVTKVIPVLDFACVSEIAMNRTTYFYDAAHFCAALGEKLKPILEGSDKPAPYGYFLTQETVDVALEEEEMTWGEWCRENRAYMEILKKRIETGEEPQIGELQEYIGF